MHLPDVRPPRSALTNVFTEHKMAKYAHLFLVALLAGLLLAACGAPAEQAVNNAAGNDREISLGEPLPIPEGAQEGPAARGASGPTSDVAGVCLSSAEAEMARLINEYRSSLNLPPIPVSK
jgi:hypothetical protein